MSTDWKEYQREIEQLAKTHLQVQKRLEETESKNTALKEIIFFLIDKIVKLFRK